MNKTITISILSLLVFSTIGLVSADTIIAGKIYNADYTETISGADVTVTCNGNVRTTTSLDDGAYEVNYDNEETCGYHDPAHTLTVYAEKDGLSGTRTGEIHDEAVGGWDLAIVNVPLVPEFGVFVGALTLLSALGVFFFVRRH